MKKIIYLITALLLCFNANAQNIEASALNLSQTQNKRLTELKENLKQEIEPIWEEIQSSRNRILEIEKKYFEEFWNLLTDEQKEQFTKLNQKQ